MIEAIIKQLVENNGYSSTSYPSPLSNRFEIPKSKSAPEIEFICIKQLDKLNDIYKILEDLDVRSDNFREFKRFIQDLSRTPLFIYGDYSKPEVFNRPYGILTNLEQFLMKIRRDDILSSQFDKVKEILFQIYSIERNGATFTQKNPLFVEIVNLIKKNKSEGIHISVVLHKCDVKGTKIRLQSCLNPEEFESISVVNWHKLVDIENQYENQRHIVISTTNPTIDYSLPHTKVNKLIFVGCNSSIEKFSNIIKYRLNESFIRPLYMLDETDNAPLLLKKLMKNISISSNKIVEDIVDDLLIEFEETYGYSYDSVSSSSVGSNMNVYSYW